jgi:hypothetical protein
MRQNQCLERDVLIKSDVDKNGAIQGAGRLVKNGITWGQANRTGMPPNLKVYNPKT